MNSVRVRPDSRIGQAILTHPREDYQVAVSLTHGAALLTIPGGNALTLRVTNELDGTWLTLEFEENAL
ncbi:Uncharacterised protein [Mycobacteroides abscessus subsp. abscessus]|nr:Uncharacterised protein [Mycobacteroides abscessus subsp. abscessus]